VIEAVEEPRRLAWVLLFPLEEGETEDQQIEVHWSFDLDVTPTGTQLSHTVHIPPPKAGADELRSHRSHHDRPPRDGAHARQRQGGRRGRRVCIGR
jgi:hypothetical protein